ncbi:hypothetical protein Tco_0964083, partial [Tanacetum coccineum]
MHDVEDQKFLYEGSKVTEAEQEELMHNEKVQSLLKKRSRYNYDDDNEYKMPESYDEADCVNQNKRFKVAVARYNDSEKDGKVAWKDQQIRKATLNFGSKNKNQSKEEAYDYVFDDQSEVVRGVDGNEEANQKKRLKSVVKSAYERLLED